MPKPAPEKSAAAPPNLWLLVSLVIIGFVGVGAAVGLLVRQPQMPDAGTPASATSSASRPAAPSPATIALQANVQVPTKWTGSIQPRWARDGSRTIAFELDAEQEVHVWMARVRPSLAVRCLSRRTEAFMMLRSAASVEADDHHTIRLAFDGEPAHEERWEGSTDGRELFAPDGVALARRLAATRGLRVTFTPYNASPVSVDFDLAGFDRLIGFVARTCGWKP